MIEQKITVTLNQEAPFKRVLMRAEDSARELLVYIVGTDGTALDMSGMMAEFRAKKPDNTEIARTEGVTIEGEYVRVKITANTIAVAGIVSCEILLHLDGVEIGTAPFDIEVWEAIVRDSSPNSHSDFQSAVAAATAAQVAADRAESFASHPNIVLNNGNWGVWNGSEYEDSGVRAVAQDGRVYEVHAGTNVTVDNTDPTNPIVSFSGVIDGSQYMLRTEYAPNASATINESGTLVVTSTYAKVVTRYDVQFVVPSGFSGMAGTISIDGVMCTVKDALNRDSNFISATGALATLTRSGTSVFPFSPTSVDYSLTERRTNRRWIDGKYIYEKVIDMGIYNTGTKTVAHNIESLSTYRNVLKVIVAGATTQWPYANAGNHAYTQFDITNVTMVSNASWGNSQAYMVIEYTKTTG